MYMQGTVLCRTEDKWMNKTFPALQEVYNIGWEMSEHTKIMKNITGSIA